MRGARKGGGRGARTGLLEVAEDEEVELRRREHPHGAGEAAETGGGQRRGQESTATDTWKRPFEEGEDWGVRKPRDGLLPLAVLS